MPIQREEGLTSSSKAFNSLVLYFSNCLKLLIRVEAKHHHLIHPIFQIVCREAKWQLVTANEIFDLETWWQQVTTFSRGEEVRRRLTPAPHQIQFTLQSGKGGSLTKLLCHARNFSETTSKHMNTLSPGSWMFKYARKTEKSSTLHKLEYGLSPWF